MIKNHSLLVWLTPEQALASLQESADSKMTLSDLFSHATQGTCPIYIKATGLKGVNPSAHSHPSSHDLYEVVGIGYQRLYMPEIYSQAGVQHVELCGDTRSAQNTGLEPELLRSITWEAKEGLK